MRIKQQIGIIAALMAGFLMVTSGSLAAWIITFAILAAVYGAIGKRKPHQVKSLLIASVIVFVIGFGYVVGKDMAVRDNERSVFQAETEQGALNHNNSATPT